MKYEFKIINKPFVKDEIEYARTALVTIYRDDGSTDKCVYGYVEMPEIEQQSETGNDINLDFCFIKNFVLSGRKIKSLSVANALIIGKADFSGTQFIGKADFSGTQFCGRADFNKAQFSRIADFYTAKFIEEADFGEVQFSEEASFRRAQFSGETYFFFAQFSEEAYFSGTQFSDIFFSEAQFSDIAYFRLAQFSGEADFFKAKLRGKANFNKVQFCGKVYSREAQFSEEADFSEAQFSEEADFSEAQFSSRAGFSNVQFSDRTDFSKAQFTDSAEFSSTQFMDHVYFVDSIFSLLILTNSIIEKTFDLSNAKFEKLSLINVKNLGYIYLEWNDNIKNSIRKSVKVGELDSQKVASPTPYLGKAWQFRLLKENFNKIGQYDDEDRAYVEFKRNEALSEYHGENEENKPKRIRNKLVFPLRWLIADLMGVYATSPIRILSSLGIIIGLFGVAYYSCGVGTSNSIFRNFGLALYYSVTTALTVGYGDINPSTFASHKELVAVLSGLEAFLGLFLMAYFTVAFSRKVLR